jgi:hypothetical protein
VDYKSFGSSFTNPRSTAKPQMIWFGDMDGNGSDDIVYALKDHFEGSNPPDAARLVLTQRTGLTSDISFSMKSLSSTWGYNFRSPVDIDQDGQSELFLQLFQGDLT